MSAFESLPYAPRPADKTGMVDRKRSRTRGRVKAEKCTKVHTLKKARRPTSLQQAFLAAYAKTGVIQDAADCAKCNRTMHYRWMKQDPEYPGLFEAADKMAVDTLVSEARRRAVQGVREPVGWFRGKAGAYVRRYSDNLLMFLIKAKCPEYRDSTRVDLHPHPVGDGDPTGAGERELDAMLATVGKPDTPAGQ